MGAENIIVLILSSLIFAYLAYTMIFPEKMK